MIRGLLIGLLLVTGLAAEDGVLAAARQALAADRPQQAIGLLRTDPRHERFGAARLLLAEALVAGGDATAARSLILADGTLQSAWPVALHGRAWMVVGRSWLADGEHLSGAQALGRALQVGGAGVEIDVCLLLIGRSLAAAGRAGLARQYAERLWYGWRRSPLRAEAGLLLGRLLVAAGDDRAVDILLAVRERDQLTDAAWRELHELLAVHLLPQRAADALLVLREALAKREDPVLRRHLAIAWSYVDPEEGLAQLRELPPEQARHAAVQQRRAALARRGSATAGPHWTHRLAQADLRWRAGEHEAARRLLQPLLADHPEAVLLACEWDWPVEELRDLAAARDPRVRVRLAQALLEQGEPQVARDLLAASFAAIDAEIADWPPAMRDRARLLIAELGGSSWPDRAAEAWAALRSEATGVEAGIAWAREAQGLASTEAPVEQQARAWQRALRDLPVVHPWFGLAVDRLARLALQAVPVGRRLEDPTASITDRLRALARALDALAWEDDGEAALRHRYLLLQVRAQLGDGAEAWRCWAGLWPHADGRRRERLRAVADRLRVWSPGGEVLEAGGRDRDR